MSAELQETSYCPQCRKSYRFKESLSGRVFTCTECGEQFRLVAMPGSYPAKLNYVGQKFGWESAIRSAFLLACGLYLVLAIFDRIADRIDSSNARRISVEILNVRDSIPQLRLSWATGKALAECNLDAIEKIPEDQIGKFYDLRQSYEKKWPSSPESIEVYQKLEKLKTEYRNIMWRHPEWHGVWDVFFKITMADVT